MVLRILFGVLLALCSLGSVASAQGATTVGVHLERISEDTWRVAFSLDTDAAAWAFARSGDNNRVGFLQVETEDVRLERVGPLDMLLLDAPTREISLTVRPDIAMMGEDYTPFLDLSGGALALYTHFFQLAPIHTPSDWLEVAPNPDLETPRHLFSFTDRTGTAVRAQGEIAAPQSVYDFGEATGGYVLFGDPDPISDIAGGIYAHPDLPERLHTTVLRSVPVALEYLEGALGYALASPPMVMLAPRPDVDGTLSFRGGAMAGQIAIQIGGEALNDAELYRRFSSWITTSINHEVVHLWNGGLVEPADDNAAWIHEGSAEALSWRALTLAFGLSETFRHAEENEALTGCAQHLEATRLTDANAQGLRRAHYDCGAIIMLVVEASLLPEGADLQNYWARLIAAALDRQDGTYDPALFHEVYAEMGGNPDVSDWIRRLTETRVDDSVAALEAGLTLVDLGLADTGEALEIVR